MEMQIYKCKAFCNANHEMTNFIGYKQGAFCRSCNQSFNCLYGCAECNTCNEQMCEKCFEQKKQAFCDKGHSCKFYAPLTGPDSVTCQTCHKVPSQNNDVYYVCELCPKQICQTCVFRTHQLKMGFQPTPQQLIGLYQQQQAGFQQQQQFFQQNQQF
ncbi:hypothetical protein TTHERM_00575340 (macronuclear) [Tetrahymena thermophila SB210]|uniref:Uncharacterized protein n=1 Tax=Tetrahymena thermophila (strain SB210) TaxID=312017 RepID=Q22V66_TETTS|nr:hypothetical protein TTHERM_00575340 [Tetrahymena thermophila SB210]EAR89082.2 hypothetical protein TTHERM_00575340 [Tetrahymena thermophila SB210]|eukprot:XP_001009327.2 hypothetical protein TTHERM_00575340 [Tetrahymena thermophila SB210]